MDKLISIICRHYVASVAPPSRRGRQPPYVSEGYKGSREEK